VLHEVYTNTRHAVKFWRYLLLFVAEASAARHFGTQQGQQWGQQCRAVLGTAQWVNGVAQKQLRLASGSA